MDTLKIQDTFEPYYAGREQAQKLRGSDARKTISSAEAESVNALARKARLDAVNRRFARARPRLLKGK